MNNTPLYIDLLDYLERDGIASLSNDFDSNAFMTNFDELDTTSPLSPTVTPTTPYIIPPLGGGDGGDGPRQGITSLDPINKIIDYTNFNHPTMNEIANDDDEYLFDAENFDEFYNPLSMGIKGSTIHEIGLAAAEKERERLREVAKVEAFERQQREAQQAVIDRAEKAAAQKRQEEADRIKNTYKQQQQQTRDAGEGRGSRQGDSDIGDDQRGGYATDDTAGFF